MQVVRQHLPSGRAALRFNIDATRRGNVARFVNHRCGDPSATLAIVWRCGEFLPVVALVARRALQAGEEVTWSYGEPSCSPAAAVREGDPVDSRAVQAAREADMSTVDAGEGTWREACRCGSDLCTGVLPMR